ncbi:hypothetical protein [Aeromonas aquatica]|uniref:hypothetical protein n=1 Tax=Aeromonas aquatica TaxID=558964 RepID=UPI00051BF7CE|nr:hypothetical protein [Aeromonas aquatica]
MKFVRILSLLVVSLIMSGCGPSIDALSETVRNSMQQQFDTNEQFKSYGLKAEKVTLIHEQDKKYKGAASVVLNGKAHEVIISVTADGNNVIWEAPPGSFMFIAQIEMQKILNSSQEDVSLTQAEQAEFDRQVAVEMEKIREQAKIEYEKNMKELMGK